MRYEHIELDLSTAACDALLTYLLPGATRSDAVGVELHNLYNELRARLQRTDVDLHSVSSAIKTPEIKPGAGLDWLME